MPVQSNNYIRSWPRYPLAVPQSHAAPKTPPAATNPAPRKPSVKFYNTSAPESPVSHTPSGSHTPRSVASGLSTPRIIRSTSWQRLHGLLRAHLAITQRHCAFKLCGRPLTSKEERLLEEVHTDAKRMAAAADTGAILLHAAATFDDDIKAKQAEAQLRSAAMGQLLRQDCMTVFFERLSRMHGLCERDTLNRWVALSQRLCNMSPPPAFVGLVWVQYMLAHEANTAAAALAQLDVLDGYLRQDGHKPLAFEAEWAQSEEAEHVHLRLTQALQDWQTRLVTRQSDGESSIQHSNKLQRRLMAVQKRMESLGPLGARGLLACT